MKLASVEEAREIDQRSQSEFGLSGEALMETAGTLAAKRIVSIYNPERVVLVVVVCGPGNNGGDGRVCARVLESLGVQAHVIDSTANLTKHTEEQLRGATLIIDALFGIGLSRDVEGQNLRLIEMINSAKCDCVSLDVPSGLNAETGLAMGAAIKASLTLTFGVAKRGFAVNEGPHFIGTLEVLDIGFPSSLVKSVASSTLGFDQKLARKFLPKRSTSANKSSSGRVQVFAGSQGMGGAAILSGLAAARIGSGYVVVTTAGDPREILAESPEFMTADLHDPSVFENPKWTAAVVGPGLGSKAGSKAYDVLENLKRSSSAPAVIDADALTVLAKNPNFKIPSDWILTPHAGEMSRLLGEDSKVIEADRFKFAKEAALKFGCIVLLKGFRTVVSDGKKSVVILSGNAALAKAGMGDVLSGLIAGLLAQGVKPFAAACLGAYVHGYLADQWIRSGRDILSFQPSDLSASLPFVLKELRST